MTGRSPRTSYDKVGEAIEKRVRELYEKRGRDRGHQLDDWLEAEKLFRTARQRRLYSWTENVGFCIRAEFGCII